VDELMKLLHSPEERASMTVVSNPYGDGSAARRIVDVLASN